MSKITLTNLVNLQNETTAVTAINGNSAILTTAIDNTLSRDGTTPNTMGSNFDMNSFRIINLPDPINGTEAVNLSTLNSAVIGTGNVPAGGTTGQSLVKTANTSFAMAWGIPIINLTGPITSVGSVTSVASQTGTGSTFVMSVAPTITGHPTIEGVTSTGATGTGNYVFSAAPTITGNVTLQGVTSTGATGTGKLVFDGSPTLVTPNIGNATATTVNGVSIVPSSGAISVINTKTLTCNNTLTFNGTDSTTLTFQGTDTYVGRATTDTFTNKTFNSTGTGNVLQVGAVTLSKGQYPAETTTGNATAGNVGEYVSASVAAGSAVALTTGVPANITSISLTAGDWDVQAMPRFTGGATTTVGRLNSSISLVSATSSLVAGCLADTYYNNQTAFNVTDPTLAIPTVRISLSSTTTVFLVAIVGFGVSTCSVYGLISARRAR